MLLMLLLTMKESTPFTLTFCCDLMQYPFLCCLSDIGQVIAIDQNSLGKRKCCNCLEMLFLGSLAMSFSIISLYMLLKLSFHMKRIPFVSLHKLQMLVNERLIIVNDRIIIDDAFFRKIRLKNQLMKTFYSDETNSICQLALVSKIGS